jgi:acylphosphatase
VVRGRVQGVSYRWYTVEEAERLGLSGWVANRSDGSVELEAEGPEPQLEELVAWLRHGPPAARVSDVEVTWSDPTGERGRFRIRRDL